LQLLQGIVWPDLATRGLGLLPIRSACLHRLVLDNDLGLQTGDLRLDGHVLSLDNLVEGRPLTLDVVLTQPVVEELEPLALEELPEHLHLQLQMGKMFPAVEAATWRVPPCARNRISK